MIKFLENIPSARRIKLTVISMTVLLTLVLMGFALRGVI
jgi:hypothetical protein